MAATGPRVPPGIPALLLLALLLLLPIFIADVMLGALAKLGLSPAASLAVAAGILFGGLVNLPVRRHPRDEIVEVAPIDLFGVHRVLPRLVRRRTYTIIAVNLGGCVVPGGVAAYQLARLAAEGAGALAAAGLAIAINTAVCYRVARPVAGAGIVMRPIVPALVAAACAILFLRELAPPIAFVSGVLGPLLGADLLHLRDIQRMNTGIASIGGAGTFDGIVLSGLVATLLA